MSGDTRPKVENLRKSPDGFDWSLISYFDILGFRDAIGAMSPEAIRRTISFTRLFSAADGPTIRGDLTRYGIKTYRFQDSYVRACELGWIKDVENPDEIDDITFSRSGRVIVAELVSLCHILINFMRQRVYLRGAVAVGEIDFGDDYALGPGLLAAYELESRQAKFPRLIVERRTLDGFLSHPWSKAFVPASVSIDHDGMPFIDYLKEACRECLASPHAFLALLREHSDWVQWFVRSCAGDQSLSHKADWLVDYHNDTVAMFPGLQRKTGWGYHDLALPEPTTAVAEFRRQRLEGKWPDGDHLLDRSWELGSYQSYKESDDPEEPGEVD